MIRIDNVSKRFDDTAAVDGLSLQVASQAIFGLIGPNGAGKTTTLKVLATLVKPDAGSVSIDGLDLRVDVRAIRRRIGYMPDSFGVFRGMTCAEYLRFFGCCHGISGKELRQRMDDVLDLTDLTRLRDDPTAGLSMGMRQRLSLAKALMHDPDILLLDEPASGLDPRARIEIRVFLKELAKMGKTIVISSHILADLEDICTDVAVIEHGKVVWSGALESLNVTDANGGAGVDVDLRVPVPDADRATELLEALPEVADVAQAGSRLRVRVKGSSANGILRHLLDHDVEVLQLSRVGSRLEDLFLDTTKGIGS